MTYIEFKKKSSLTPSDDSIIFSDKLNFKRSKPLTNKEKSAFVNIMLKYIKQKTYNLKKIHYLSKRKYIIISNSVYSL